MSDLLSLFLTIESWKPTFELCNVDLGKEKAHKLYIEVRVVVSEEPDGRSGNLLLGISGPTALHLLSLRVSGLSLCCWQLFTPLWWQGNGQEEFRRSHLRHVLHLLSGSSG